MTHAMEFWSFILIYSKMGLTLVKWSEIDTTMFSHFQNFKLCCNSQFSGEKGQFNHVGNISGRYSLNMRMLKQMQFHDKQR